MWSWADREPISRFAHELLLYRALVLVVSGALAQGLLSQAHHSLTSDALDHAGQTALIIGSLVIGTALGLLPLARAALHGIRDKRGLPQFITIVLVVVGLWFGLHIAASLVAVGASIVQLRANVKNSQDPD